jgi:hypothetical protein
MIKNLPVFPSALNLSVHEIQSRLASSAVRQVTNFVLGPTGNNIEQACKAWIQEKGIKEKAEIVLCRTPEDSLVQARLVEGDGVVPLFWTCAVFFRLYQLFFLNSDTYPFLLSFNFLLDNMQLCCRPEHLEQLKEHKDSKWRVASHPSPASLLAGLSYPVINATSNADAAIRCARGEVELCVTTAQAAKIHELTMLHEFGSPTMVFFAGTTKHGMRVLRGQ